MKLKAALLAAALPFAITFAGAETANAKVTLKMSHQWTENNAGSVVDKWFADEIEKRTDGEVKIRILCFSNKAQ